MGYILTGDELEGAGEYGAELRSESFHLYGEANFVRKGDAACPPGCTAEGPHTHGDHGYVKQRHGINLYPRGDSGQGTVEILLEDIPKLRAILDSLERLMRKERGGVPWETEMRLT